MRMIYEIGFKPHDMEIINTVLTPQKINWVIDRVIKVCNDEEEETAKEQHRTPELLHILAHIISGIHFAHVSVRTEQISKLYRK